MLKLNKLRAKIIEKYGTYYGFSEKIKADESYISRIVCGRRTLPNEKQIEWAEALGCDPEDLFENRGA